MQDHIIEHIRPYRVSKTWQIQIAASRCLLELEFQCKGIDAALQLFINYLNDETSLRGFCFFGSLPCDSPVAHIMFAFYIRCPYYKLILVASHRTSILNLLIFIYAGQTKLGVCALRISQMIRRSDGDNYLKSDTLIALLRLLESPLAFNNVTLRHYIFCILQVLANRCVDLHFVCYNYLNSDALTWIMFYSYCCWHGVNLFILAGYMNPIRI